MKFEAVYAECFQNRCNMMTYDFHKLGEKLSWIFKMAFGFSGLSTVLVLIIGPLIIFSTLNPIAELNLVTGAQF